MNHEHESEQIVLPKKKRTRGPTMCKDVHEWTLEERKLIVLNEMGKPIGPNDKTVDTFTRLLGTFARNASLAPLNKINWHHVKDKEEIWNYMKVCTFYYVFKF
ncbi:uncharacterized protein LOC110692754 [Chenopodium quinoa]|uniref:uncharacterized protein LOC110692754 n=1 Tax=Chenopodium quinoa TaxID=63459 RepID=UPI000B788A6C|nr:uncharacterized protein LOC110692754 [Chenopodium quinoa]